MTARMNISGLALGMALIIVVPSRLTRVDARGISKQVLLIQSDKSSPAYAALEDVRFPELVDETSVLTQEMNQHVSQVAHLSSGQTFSPLQSDIFAEPVVKLSKLVIRAESLEGSQELASFSSPKIEVVSTQPPLMTLNFGPDLRSANGSLLPLEERKKRLLSFYTSESVDTPQPTFGQRAQPLVEQALKDLASTSGIAGASPAPLLPSAPATSPKVLRLTREQGAPLQPAPEQTEIYRPLVLSGQLQMTEGLAFVGRLRVFRTFNGEKFEDGRINIQEGSFEIWVKEARGYIEAELLDDRDQALGRTELDLTQLPMPKSNQGKISGLSLKLRPVSNVPTISVVSSYSFASHKVEIPGAEVRVDDFEALAQNEDGDFVEPEFHPQSIFVARAEARNYWGSLAVGLGSSPLEIQLFPNKMVNAMLSQALNEGSSPARQAVIWGKIVDWRGHPLSGATVELAGDSKAKLVYFNNHFLPDTSFRQTSSTGWFAFVNVTPGIHSIRAIHNHRYIPAQTLPAEVGYVSYAQLQFGEVKTAQIHIHDAFDAGSNLGSIVHVLGADADLEINGHGAIKYLSGHGSMTLEVDSGEDFELERFQLPRNVHGMNFPMIRRSWYAEVAGRKRINVDPSRGSLAGFVREADFEIELRREGQAIDGQVVYFNKNGQPIDGTYGSAGGGFLVYNVASGPVDLVVRLAGENRVVFQTHYVESDVVSVVSLSRSRPR